MAAQPAPKVDRVTLGMTDGQEVEGFLTRFTPMSPQLLFARAVDGAEQVIPREKVAFVALHRLPEHPPTPDRPGMAPLKVHTQAGRDFVIVTQLGAHGSLWFQGYPVDSSDPYHRIFFFRHGVRHKERLEPLGAILVGEGVVAAEEVAQAVAAQKADRETPLGAILVEQRKIEARHIEQAMAIQARRRMKLGEVLIEEGLVERSDVEAALTEQQRRRGRKLGDILVERGTVDQGHLLAALGVKFDLPFVDLDDYPVQPHAFAAVPLPIQRSYGIVPIARDTRSITIAINDPLATEVYDIVQALVDLEVREVLATREQIQGLIERGGAAPAAVEPRDAGATTVRAALRAALKRGADAVLCRPGFEGLRIACRVEGEWQILEQIDRARQSQVVATLLGWAAMERFDPSQPQEGVLPFEEGRVFRVSTLPTPVGPSVVLEPLPAVPSRALENLGLASTEVEQLRGWLKQPGLLVAAGAARSGRTTTLEALLGEVARGCGHVLLLTEALRLSPHGIDLFRVPPDLNSPAALQAARRHAPDALAWALPLDGEMLGAAIVAARTIPVLLRLEAGSAAEAVDVLRRLGLASLEMAATLRGVVAQRLAERLCPECRIEVGGEDEIRILLQGRGIEGQGALFRRGAGCSVCDGKGVAGKVAIFEVLAVEGALRQAIVQEVAGGELAAATRGVGMAIFSEQALSLARQGLVDAQVLLS